MVITVFSSAAVLYHRYRARNAVSQIEVLVTPADSTIVLDGQELANRSPVALTVRPGTHNLTLTHDGYVRVDHQMEVHVGETVEVPVSLVKVTAADAPGDTPGSPSPTAARQVSPRVQNTGRGSPGLRQPEGHSARGANPSGARSVKAKGVLYLDMKTGTFKK